MLDSLFSERGLSLDRLKVLIEVRDAGSIAQAAPGAISMGSGRVLLYETALGAPVTATPRRGLV